MRKFISNAALCGALTILSVAASSSFVGSASAQTASDMGFFVTSTGTGKGADLGGVTGADQLCQRLATAAGAGSRTWRAYLSTQAEGSTAAINARDRIGAGPWKNAKGEVIATSVDNLHGENKLTKQSALNEKGEIVNGRGDSPNMHDILTGTQTDGRAYPAGDDMTCRNWTSSTDGKAMLGHADRTGLTDDPPAKSWNTSHASRGCSQDALKSTGGAGLLYCFAER